MTARERVLEAARAAGDGTIRLYLGGVAPHRRIEAVRGAPWGDLEDERSPWGGIYVFHAREVVEWLEANP
jgi:hypothetical protein